MDVHKTLVIGRGSTGANAVERLASAVTWELGDIDRAPWLEYLCLETNAGETVDLPQLRRQDFLVMGVERSELAMMAAEPGQFDAVNGLSRWIDVPTVRKLPDGSVQAGAGNIRMVGRLAFLHRENFESIKQAVAERLDRLRALSERDATATGDRCRTAASRPCASPVPACRCTWSGRCAAARRAASRPTWASSSARYCVTARASRRC